MGQKASQPARPSPIIKNQTPQNDTFLYEPYVNPPQNISQNTEQYEFPNGYPKQMTVETQYATLESPESLYAALQECLLDSIRTMLTNCLRFRYKKAAVYCSYASLFGLKLDSKSKHNVDVNDDDDVEALRIEAAGPRWDINAIVRKYPKIGSITKVFEAALCGNIQRFKFLLINRAELGFTDAAKWTIMQCACFSGQEEIIQILLERNFSLNGCLCAAIYGHQTKVIEWLIDVKGVSADNTLFNRSANYWAAVSGNLKAIQLLQIEPMAQIAADHGQSEVIRMSQQCQVGLTKAIARNHRAVIDMLVDEKTVNELDFKSLIQSGATYTVGILVKTGIYPTVDFGQGQTLLHFAASHNDTELATLLLKRGFDINVKDAYEMSPLHMAVKFDKPDMIDFLIANGAEIEIKNFMGRTPMHIAAWDARLSAVQALLKHGADINAVDEATITPLTYCENDIMKQFMIDNGAITGPATNIE